MRGISIPKMGMVPKITLLKGPLYQKDFLLVPRKVIPQSVCRMCRGCLGISWGFYGTLTGSPCRALLRPLDGKVPLTLSRLGRYRGNMMGIKGIKRDRFVVLFLSFFL